MGSAPDRRAGGRGVRLRRRLARAGDRLRSLRTRIALAAAVFVAASMWIGGSVQIASIETQVERTLVEFQRREVAGVAAQISARVSDRAESLLAMARDGADRDAWSDEVVATAYLTGRPTIGVLFGATAVARLDGTLLAFVEQSSVLPVAANVADRPSVRQALETGAPAVSDALIDRVRGGARVVVSVPARRSDGTVVGTLNGLIDLAGDAGIAGFARAHAGSPDRARLFLLDGEGIVLASDDPALPLRSAVEIEDLRALIARTSRPVLAPGASGAEVVDDQVVAWTPVPGTRWRVIALSPAAALFASMHATRDGALREAAIAAVLAAIAMSAVAAWLLSPIARLRDRAMRLRDDPRAIAGGWPAGRDEIGELSRVLQDVVRARSAAEQDARASLSRVQAILDNVTVGVAVTRDASFEVVSPSFAAIVGFEIEDMIGRQASMLFPDREAFERQRRENAAAIGRDGRCDVETTMRHRDGRELRVRLIGSPLDSHSRDAATIWVMEDVTGRRAEQRQLRLSHELITRSHEALVVTDELDRVIVANPAFAALSGRPVEAVLGRPASSAGLAVLPGAGAPRETDGTARVETTVLRPDGSEVPCWASVSRVELDGGRRVTLWMLADIGPLKAAQDELRRLAMHDPLTGLPNRAAFRMQLEAAVRRARRGGRELALMFVDLDGFKAVNDAHGHDAGDALLREIAARLLATVRASDTVCRLGGDEFTVIAEGLAAGASIAEADALCARMIEALARPVELGAARASVTASIGVCLYPVGARTVDALVREADAAMYRAKRAGKDRWVRGERIGRPGAAPGADAGVVLAENP